MEDKMGAGQVGVASATHMAIRIAAKLREYGYEPATVAGEHLKYVSRSDALGILAEPKNKRSGIARLVFGDTPRDFIGVFTFGKDWGIDYYGADNYKRVDRLAQQLYEFFNVKVIILLSDEAYRKEQKGPSD